MNQNSAAPARLDAVLSADYPVLMDQSKMDKSAYQVGTLSQPSDEREYWLSKTPQERLEALEFMRQAVFGYDPAITRLQRVYSVTQRESC